MNGAIKYFREHGLKKSKKHLLDIREAANQVSWVHSLEGFSQDLKRLVESHELVESYKGLHCAKNTLGLLQSSMEIGLYHGMDGVDAATEIPRLKQAIADVESCLEVEKKLEGL